MNTELKNTIIEIIRESSSIKAKEKFNFQEETEFSELGIDSISMLSILLKLEEKLSLDLSKLDEQLGAPRTVGELNELVFNLVATVNINN